MRLYLGNAAPPAVREYREDADGEILPLVGRDGLPRPTPADEAMQQDEEQEELQARCSWALSAS
eukprot:5290484-Pyramimonas_sp.AAC.1